MKYIVGIDQSTQSTKALLVDLDGHIIAKSSLPHKQIIDSHGWVSHDPEEIFKNTCAVIRNSINTAKIDPCEVCAIAISNQRETCLGWNRETGKSLGYAIVWHCSRAESVFDEIRDCDRQRINYLSGLIPSPYFSAAKFAWMLRNDPQARSLSADENLCLGTIDSYLVFRLTDGKSFKTDYSNAARTQLFDIHNLFWSSELCSIFKIPSECLPDVIYSDGDFGQTTLDGFFSSPVNICSVLGDSNSSLYAQGCFSEGQTKVTYGTGSSVMMNIRGNSSLGNSKLSTSIAWATDKTVDYVLEGNINYTGAVITWLEKDLGLISSADETSEMAKGANPQDKTYLVPAFSGLGAPYWDDNALGLICGLSRTSGKKEIVKAALDSIAFQINDVLSLMKEKTGVENIQLMADGGPTSNDYLMQRQSDISQCRIMVSPIEDMSAYGVVLLVLKSRFSCIPKKNSGNIYEPCEDKKKIEEDYQGWKRAVYRTLSQSKGGNYE